MAAALARGLGAGTGSDAPWEHSWGHTNPLGPAPNDDVGDNVAVDLSAGLSSLPADRCQLRAMLAVSYFEKALYELPDDEVTKENVIALAEKTELEVQGGPGSRPMLSIPHLVSDEASCYYHGYTLAVSHFCRQ